MKKPMFTDAEIAFALKLPEFEPRTRELCLRISIEALYQKINQYPYPM